MWDMRISYDIFVGNREARVPFGRARRRKVAGRIILKRKAK
jgi:hypothetical protein